MRLKLHLVFFIIISIFCSSNIYAISLDTSTIPSSVCVDEVIDIVADLGTVDLNLSWGEAATCAIDILYGGSYSVTFTYCLMEEDGYGNPHDEIDCHDSTATTTNCSSVNLNNYFGTIQYRDFLDVTLSDEFTSGTDASTIEIFAKAYSDRFNTVITSSYDVDKAECDCLSGSCCDTSSRPYSYKSNGSQPTDISDTYYCSAGNSATSTNYVKKRNYYCNGTSSSYKYSDSTYDTCGTCEYCTAGDSSCNDYDSSASCGTRDCDYLDTTCRNYNDESKKCDGAGTCDADTCNDYTNTSAGTSCGSGKECDGNGNCGTCTSHADSSCSGDDLYYYDACGNREEMKQDCGSDSSFSWEKYCDGSDLRRKRNNYNRYCSNDACGSSTTVEDEIIETCPDGCIVNSVQAVCKEICNEDSDCGSVGYYPVYCSDGDRYRIQTTPNCNRPGQSDSFCSYDETEILFGSCDYGCSDGECIIPNCTEECTAGETRCSESYSQECGNYDSDPCLEWPPSTSVSGNEDCSDCSCSCGGYNVPEVDNFCNDGLDNNCNGLIDIDDTGCSESVDMTIDWELTFDDGGEEQGNSVVKVYGGYMAAGYTDNDSFLGKTGPTGSYYWGSNTGHTAANSIEKNGENTSIIVGSTNWPATETPYSNTLYLGGSNIYLSHIDYNGNESWSEIYGNFTRASLNYDDYGYDVVVVGNGPSYVVAGSTEATGNLFTSSAYVFWAEHDGSKQIDAQFSVKGGDNAAYSITRDGVYDYYITGFTTNYQADLKYIYALKFSLSSGPSFQKTWGYDYGTGVGNAIEMASDGPIIAGTKDSNSYLLKIDKNGIKTWDMQLDSGEANSVKVDSNGDYIVLATKGDDIQIYKVASDGNSILWKKTFDNSTTDKGKDFIIDGYDYVVTGQRDGDLYLMKTKTQLPPSEISLLSGWNLVSLSKQPKDSDIQSVLLDMKNKYSVVWTYSDGSWRAYDPAKPGLSDLTTMEAGRGYWIKANEAASFEVPAAIQTNTTSLASGWNLVGYNFSTSKPIGDAIESIADNCISVMKVKNGELEVYSPDNPGLSNLTTMEPGYGYWIKMKEPAVWTLP